MKKLNNKGYLIVEIIVASVLAMTIGYFLIRLVIKFSAQQEDTYMTTKYISDKNILTTMIIQDVEKLGVKEIEIAEKKVTFTFNDSSSKELIIDSNNKITYDGYIQQFDNSLTFGIINIEYNDNYISINIPMTTNYSNEDYGIKLLIQNYEIIIKERINATPTTTYSCENGDTPDANRKCPSYTKNTITYNLEVDYYCSHEGDNSNFQLEKVNVLNPTVTCDADTTPDLSYPYQRCLSLLGRMCGMEQHQIENCQIKCIKKEYAAIETNNYTCNEGELDPEDNTKCIVVTN